MLIEFEGKKSCSKKSWLISLHKEHGRNAAHILADKQIRFE